MSRMRRVIIPLLIVVVLLVAVQTVMRGKSSNPSSVKKAPNGLCVAPVSRSQCVRMWMM